MKFLKFSVVFILILLFFGTSVFATYDVTVTDNHTTYSYNFPDLPDVPSGYDKYICFYNIITANSSSNTYDNIYVVIYYNGDLYYKCHYEYSNYQYDLICTGQIQCYSIRYHSGEGAYESDSNWSTSRVTTLPHFSSSTELSTEDGQALVLSRVLYSSHDIYSDRNKTSVVFQQAPLPIRPTKVEIAKLETAEQIPETITQVLQIVIPVGLIILSVLLVISLMRLVIYRMQ